MYVNLLAYCQLYNWVNVSLKDLETSLLNVNIGNSTPISQFLWKGRSLIPSCKTTYCHKDTKKFTFLFGKASYQMQVDDESFQPSLKILQPFFQVKFNLSPLLQQF